MASKNDKYIEDLIKSIRSKSTTETPEKQAYDPAKQAAGLEARLEGSGIKEDKRDTRNIVEKALNLTPKQNVLFDVFEIINRPQQMLFQGIKAAQEGEDVGKAIRKGFGGVGEDVQFKEILHNAGMEDSEKKFGLDDVLGFVGDVVADPIDLGLVVATPFTGGASGAVLGAKKAIQAADTATDTLKSIDAALTVAKAANNTAEIAKLTKQFQQAQKAASKLQESKKLWQNLETAANNLTELKKVAKKTGNTDGLADALTAYKRAVQPLKKRMTPLEFTFKKVKGGLGKSIDLADDGITGVLTKLDGVIDNSRIKQVQNALDIDVKEARKLQDKFNAIRPWSTKYADMKAAVNGIFDAAKAIPKGLWNKTKELTGGRKLAVARMSKLQLENIQDIAKVAKDMNLDPDDVSRMLMRNYEYMKHKPDMKFMDMFDETYINNNPMTENNYQAFKAYIRETFKDADGFSKYSEAAIDDLFTVKTIKEGSELKIWLPKQDGNNKKYLQEMLDDVNRDFAKVSRDNEKFGKRMDRLQEKYNKLQETQAKASEYINKNSNRFATIDGKTVAILTSDELADLKKLGIDLKPDKNGVVTHDAALKRINARIKNADKSLAKIDTPIISSVESKLVESGVEPVKFKTVTHTEFKDALEKVRPNLVNPQSVTVYDDYSNAKTFLSADGKVGFAIQPDGNIISVFSDPSNKGSLKTIMPMAIANGGNKLDAYAVKSLSKQDAKTLVNLYEGYGFKPVAKVKWVDEYADAAWDYNKFGRPDIVFMVHNGDSVDNVIKNVNKYETISLDKIKYVDEWDEGVALQNKSVKKTDGVKIKVGKSTMTPDQAKKSLTSLKEKMVKAKEDITNSKKELSQYISDASGEKLIKQADKMKELQDNLRPIVHDRVMPASRYYDDNDVLEMQEFFKAPEMEELYKRFDERHTAMFQDLNDLLGTALDGEGYLRHVLNDEYAQEIRNLPKNVQAKLRDSGIIGNTSTFRGRAYQMSAYEANAVRKQITQNMLDTGKYSDDVRETLESLVDLDMFEVDAASSTWDFIRNAPKEIEKGRRIEETLKASLANGVAGTLLDPEMLKPFEAMTKFENGKMITLVDTSRQTLVSASDLYNKIDELGYAFQNETLMQAIKSELQASKASQLVIDKNLYNLIGFTTDKTINEVAENTVKLIDKTNNMFKKFKLLSPGFQIRNLVGNFTNILLSGVNPYKIMDNNILAHRVLAQGDALMTKRAKNIPLSAGEVELLDLFESFTKEGFDQIIGATDMANIASVYDIPEDIAKMMRKGSEKSKNYFKRLMAWNARTNELVDRQFRMSAYIYAQRNPEILTRVGVDTPAEFVRKVLFDPNDLSKVEQQYLKRLIPFYTFTKKNLAYQMRNVWDNPNRYNKLMKSVDSSWSMLDIDPKTDLEQYKRENMWIPVFVNQNGEYKALKANLPVADFGEFMSDPMKKIVSSTAPAIRTPFELTMNTQAFTQMPIQEFKGQRGYQLPFVGRKVEYGLSQLGLDVPIAAGYDLARGAGQVAQGNIGQGLETGVGRSFLSNGSVEKARLSADYQRLNDLRDLMKYYKQEGKRILTLDEIASLQQDKSQSIIQRIRAIGRT